MAKSKNKAKLSAFSRFSKQQLIIAGIFILGFGGFGVWKLAFSSAATSTSFFKRYYWDYNHYRDAQNDDRPQNRDTSDCIRVRAICHGNGQVIDEGGHGAIWESNPDWNNDNHVWYGPYEDYKGGTYDACWNIEDGRSAKNSKLEIDVTLEYNGKTGYRIGSALFYNSPSVAGLTEYKEYHQITINEDGDGYPPISTPCLRFTLSPLTYGDYAKDIVKKVEFRAKVKSGKVILRDVTVVGVKDVNEVAPIKIDGQ